MSTPAFRAALLVPLILSASGEHALAQRDLPPDCESALQHALPASDQPDAQARERLDGCSAETLYYTEVGQDDDARLCAWIEREQGDELVFGGSAVLMMIYANGRGVVRDPALARRFACEVNAAPAELDARLAYFDEMLAGRHVDQPFDLCDHATSGYLMGFCADRDARAAQFEREMKLQALLEGWNDADLEAWGNVRAASESFFQARIDREVDTSGTARGMLIAGERDSLERGLYEHLVAFEQGEFPQGDAAALAASDRKLNASYAAARKAATPESADDPFTALGSIEPDGIRAAERAWITYRDAWVAFGAQRYPAVSREAWLDLFTRERESQLSELASAGE
jgi:uncharacterized protein YecT (DUF1311 family)